jgi:hypothetical protein
VTFSGRGASRRGGSRASFCPPWARQGAAAVATHIYSEGGLYTAVVTASNAASVLTATTVVSAAQMQMIPYEYDGLKRLVEAQVLRALRGPPDAVVRAACDYGTCFPHSVAHHSHTRRVLIHLLSARLYAHLPR